jgi:hypothetical protein
MEAAPTLQVEIPMVVAVANSLQADLDTAVAGDARSLEPKAAWILPEEVAVTWAVHQLWEIIPIAWRVHGYSEKPVTQKRSSHACLIIEILAWIQNSSLIYLSAIDVWGLMIARGGVGMEGERPPLRRWSSGDR